MRTCFILIILYVSLCSVECGEGLEIDTQITVFNHANYDICISPAVHLSPSCTQNPSKSTNKFFMETNMLYGGSNKVHFGSQFHVGVSCIKPFPETWREIFNEGVDTIFLAIFKTPEIDEMSRNGKYRKDIDPYQIPFEWLRTRNDKLPLYIFKLTQDDFVLGGHTKELDYYSIYHQ
jgi:hypothetical protein